MRHFIPQCSNGNAKEVFEVSPGLYIGAGIVVDTSNGTPIGKLVFTGLGAQGQKLWEKRYGNSKLDYLTNPFTQRSMFQSDGFFYYVGCAIDSIGKEVGLFIKVNSNGDTLWQKRYKSSDPSEDLVPQMAAPSIDGGFLITGFYENFSNNSRTCLLIKTDIGGVELWRKKINKTAPNVLDGKAIIQDSASKKIVIGGYQYKTGNANYDNFIITDSLGNNPIQKSYTNSGGWITDLIQTWDKKIVAIGWMYTTVSLYSQPTMQPFAVKFDLNNPNNPIWKSPNVSIYALYNGYTGIRELKSHDLLICGIVDTISGVVGASNMDPLNIWVRFSLFGDAGNLKREQYYDYKNNNSAVQNIQGMRSFNLCQDGGWVGAIDLANYGVNPFMFVRYDSSGCDTTQEYCKAQSNTVAVNGLLNNINIEVYPNPSRNEIFISGLELYKTQIRIYSLRGVQVYHKLVEVPENSVRLFIGNLDPGMYFVEVQRNSQAIARGKIVVEN